MRQRLRRSLVVGLAAALLIAGCSKNADDNNTTPGGPTTLRVTSIHLCSDQINWGIQKGIFADHNLEIELVDTTSGTAGVSAVVGGSADIAFVDLSGTLAAITQGLPMQIVAGYAKGTPASNGLIVRADSGIDAVADLQGKKIAVVSLESLQAVTTQQWIKKETGEESTAELVALPFAEMVGAVETGTVDAAAVPGSLVAGATARGMKDLGSPIYAMTGPSATAFYIATEDFIGSHKDALAEFAKAMDEASQQFQDPANKEERYEAMTEYCKTPVENIARAPDYEWTGYVDMDAFATTLEQLKSWGVADASLTAESIVAETARK